MILTTQKLDKVSWIESYFTERDTRHTAERVQFEAGFSDATRTNLAPTIPQKRSRN